MSSKLIITSAETAAERKAFILFLWEVYKNDPNWVPPLISEREYFLDPQRHPFHQHAKVKYFIARRDNKIVGTIAGIINYNHNKHWDDEVGFFGMFEVLEDPEAAKTLLNTAEDFVRGEGMRSIRGPMNFSTNEECGLLIDGWNGPPVVLLTYNPRYYVDYINAAGYVKARDLYAYIADISHCKVDGTGLPPKLLRIIPKLKKRTGFTIHRINPRVFDTEASEFKAIYNAAWAKNWGFVPLTNAELDHEIKSLRAIADLKTIYFAEKNGQSIGATFPLPDINQALLRAYPRPGVPEWWTKLKLLYYWKVRKSVTTLRGFAGGVIEEYRGLGVDAVLSFETILEAIAHGYKKIEFSWILENNRPMRRAAETFGGKIYRTYRIYEKPL